MKPSTVALLAVAAVVAIIVIRQRAQTAAIQDATTPAAGGGTSRSSAENVPPYAGQGADVPDPGSDVFGFMRAAQAYEYAMS